MNHTLEEAALIYRIHFDYDFPICLVSTELSVMQGDSHPMKQVPSDGYATEQGCCVKALPVP